MKAFSVYLVSLVVLGGAASWAIVKPKRTPGPCEPYAEICRHCTDCSQCGHCAGKGGKCSVCFKR